MFVEDIQWADNETRIAAEQACDGNTVCLFDAASTNDVSIGTNSKDLNVQLVEEKKLLGKATSGAFRWETKNTKAPLWLTPIWGQFKAMKLKKKLYSVDICWQNKLSHRQHNELSSGQPIIFSLLARKI